MIPKIIHYCWFGSNPMPRKIEENISEWKKILYDYEFILWNENNFDIRSGKFISEAYDNKKYAFVTDYVRLHVLKKHGGIYMDTDVEVLKPLDDFLIHRAFTGCEDSENCVTGIMGAEENHPWINRLLDYYEDKTFLNADGTVNNVTNTKIITDLTKTEYRWIPKNEYQILKDDLHIYPTDYFCVKDVKTGKVNRTQNSHTIHHFSGTWLSKKNKFNIKLARLIGEEATNYIRNILSFKKM